MSGISCRWNIAMLQANISFIQPYLTFIYSTFVSKRQIFDFKLEGIKLNYCVKVVSTQQQ